MKYKVLLNFEGPGKLLVKLDSHIIFEANQKIFIYDLNINKLIGTLDLKGKISNVIDF